MKNIYLDYILNSINQILIEINIKCIKSLYKSTYKKNAFSKNKRYKIIRSEDNMYYIVDNKGMEFNFTINELPDNKFYLFNDYFKII